MIGLIDLQLLKHGAQVPLLQITCLIASVQNLSLWIEVHTPDREEHGLLIRANLVRRVPDLLLFIVKDLPAEQVVFVRAGHDSIEVKIAVHVSRNDTVVAFEELANLYLGEVTFSEGSKRTF